MKKLTLLLCLMMLVGLTGCKSIGVYTAGKYEAEGYGMGLVKVSVEVTSDKIKAIDADVSNETDAIGGAAKDEIIKQIIDKQSTDIDGVAGATITTNAIVKAVDKALAKARGEEVLEKAVVADGTYTAKRRSLGVVNEL